MHGFKIIGDMTKDEMIEELLAYQRQMLDSLPDEEMKRHIIQIRMASVQRRFVEEAKLQDAEPRGLFG